MESHHNFPERKHRTPESLEEFYREVFGERVRKRDGEWQIQRYEGGQYEKLPKGISETLIEPSDIEPGTIRGAYLRHIAVKDFDTVKAKLEEFQCLMLTNPDIEYLEKIGVRAAMYYDRAGNLLSIIEDVA